MDFINFPAVGRAKRSAVFSAIFIVLFFCLSGSFCMAWTLIRASEAFVGPSPSGKTGKTPAGFTGQPSAIYVEDNPGQPYLLSSLAPAIKPESGDPPDNETIDGEGSQPDVDDLSANFNEKDPTATLLPGPVEEPLDSAPRQENSPGPERSAEKPGAENVNRNAGDSHVTDKSSLSPPGAAPPLPDKTTPIAKSRKPVKGESPQVIGGTHVYVVKKRESLRMVGAKMGADWRIIAKDNHLDPKKRLEPGSKILVDNRKIVPKSMQNGIIINIPDRTLYLFRDNRLEKALPVGLGRKQPGKGADWRTPTGKFSIVGKQKNPTWHVPPSIQKEMRKTGKMVSTSVPPGNRNPLGKYAIRTSLSGVMIHSTLHPESVYGFASHGCIRMLPGNIEELYNYIRNRTSGEIIYQPVKMAVTGEGRILLEVHADVYNRKKNLEIEVIRLLAANDVETRVDWNKIRASLKFKFGKAEDITLERDPQMTAHGAVQASLSTP